MPAVGQGLPGQDVPGLVESVVGALGEGQLEQREQAADRVGYFALGDLEDFLGAVVSGLV